MPDENRPDPDQLLAAIHYDEKKKQEAQLRIFFGMAAGVGKTYAMLKAAHERIQEGDDVVIGTIDTHKRQETEALLIGVPIIPRKKIEYRGTILLEMDLEAILKRKPKIVLVDELAHTNVPGSLHPKRWQDVFDLLNADINVYTTLNVQHIESRKDSIEQITGISIRETVPDSLIERANQIELIDLSPNELLKRLKEGKVYLGEMANMAAQNFFQEDNLTALREISLRLTAEKVDHELQRMLAIKQVDQPWKTGDRLMVAIDHNPFSEKLIRETRRLAFNLESPWVAVYIDSGKRLGERERQSLSKNMELARELGADVLSYADINIVSGLKKVAQQKKVTKLIIGRSKKRWPRDYFTRGNNLHRLIKEIQDIDLHVLSKEHAHNPPSFEWPKIRIESGPIYYLVTFSFLILITFLSKQIAPPLSYRIVGLIYLMAISATGIFAPIGPTLFTALFSLLAWDYFFIPPEGIFLINNPEDIALCLVYFFVTFMSGILTNRIVTRESMLLIREERTETMYEIVRNITSYTNKHECIDSVTDKLGTLLNGECAVALKDTGGQLNHYMKGSQWWFNRPKEWGVSQWVFTHQKSAGWSTDTLPLSEALYIPLKGPSEIVGILAYRPKTQNKFLRDEENLLYAVARQLAIFLEKELIQERALLAQKTEEAEKLQQKLIYSITEDIKRPLAAIMQNVHRLNSLRHEKKTLTNEELEKPTIELLNCTEKLKEAIDNLPEIS